MARETEISSLDLRYEAYRMRNSASEARLLASISERGIEEPLEGVESASGAILLNGFKRYRCAKKLNLGMVPYRTLGGDETQGILALLRVSNDKALGILEQARFIEKLNKVDRLDLTEIAEQLSRSKSWVSMRLGLIGQMPESVREEIFNGRFPVYSYMYTLRPFMRMNGEGRALVEGFVKALSGKRLSVREIEQLAHCCFRGPENLRAEILKGNVALPLERMRQVPPDPDGCTPFEVTVLRDLEITGKYMQRLAGKLHDERLKNRSFFAQANLLTAGILSRTDGFLSSLRRFHDRSGDA